MTYILDKTWPNLASDATAVSTNLRESLIHGKESFEEWIHFSAGRSNAAIAAALGVTEAQVADLAAAHQAALELYNFATNVAGPLQGDRFFGLRKFS